MRCDWNLAKTLFGIVLEYFRRDAIGTCKDTIWNCFRIFSMRCDWNLAQTQIGIVLELFRGDAIGIWLRHNLVLS